MNKLFTHLLAVSAITLTSAGYANAATYTFDDGIVELGTTYTVPDFCAAEGALTISETGTLLQVGVTDLLLKELFDANGDNARKFQGYGENGQMYTWEVEAGTTYTVSASFVMNGGDVLFIMLKDYQPNILEVSPAQGEAISPVVNMTGDVYVRFNQGVTISSATMLVGDKSINLTYTQPSTNTINVNVAEDMRTLYNDGTLDKKGGDNIQIAFTGIKNSSGLLYNSDGNLTIDYVSGPNPANLVSTNLETGGTFKSYYAVGDTDGIFTFEFDNDLLNDGTTFLEITAGEADVDNYYYEPLPVTIDGTVITADCTGKLRNLLSVIENGGYVGCKLVNVRGEDGTVTSGSGDGNVGSYSYTLYYNYIEPANISSEFSPKSGGSLVDVSSIEIWFNNNDKFVYDGVVFSYEKNGETIEIKIAKDDCDIEIDGKETIINVTIPEDVKGLPTIVSLYNIVSYDGYDHSRQVMAYYDMFYVSLHSPIADGDEIASTGTGNFEIKVNEPTEYIRYDFYAQVTSAHTDGWVGGGVFTQDGSYYVAPNSDYTCYSDFTPYMVVSAYNSESDYQNGNAPVGTFTFWFVGTTAPFEFSAITLLEINPSINETLTVDSDIVVKFDGLVYIMESQSGLAASLDGELKSFDSITATDGGEDGAANSWTLTPNAEYLKDLDTVYVIIKVVDMDGAVVEGNTGEFENSLHAYKYTVSSTSGITSAATDSASRYEVYNLQGMRVLSTTDSSAVNRLPAGLYIVNGKKLYIK